MDYEKKYKEAIKRAKDMLSYKEVRREDMEYLFPELRESEDERIKRCISDAVRKYGVEFATGTVTKEKMLAWLEKQGEQKSNNESIDTCDSLTIKSKEFLASEKRDFGYFSESDNKVEPKFKVGDWVVIGDTIAQILDIQYYVGLDINGKDFTSSRFLSDDKIHLWTIQDAKDGDVLADDDEVTGCPFIFHYLTEEQNPRSYCGVDTSGHFQVNDENGEFWCSSYKVKPATKEQRDLLFKKMKEAGYEWDADNKELKKIEQNPTERSLPYEKNETVEKLIALAECLEMDGDCLFNGLSGDDYGKLLRVLAIELTEVKSDWSEENEEIIKEACKIINCYGNIITEQNEANKAYRIADKLKSLKDRIKKAKYI